MTPEQTHQMVILCNMILVEEPLLAIGAHVRAMLAAERAAAVEECAKAMDDQAREWSDYKDSMPVSATAEHNYVQGRINAFTEADAAIRKLGEKRGPD